MPGRITIQDLARVAGVGRSTVSRALRNDPRCSPATRQRIQALAAQQGYCPDPALSALVAHREKNRPPSSSYNLAIVDDEAPGGDAYRSAIWKGIETAAGRFGYAIEYLQPASYSGPRQLASVARARGVRGLIWAWLYDPCYLDEFPWDRFAHIGFLLPVVRPRIHRVRDDAFRTVFDAASAAFAAGYERPALAIMTTQGSVNDRFQSAGWLQAHSEAGRSALPIYYSRGQPDRNLIAWFDQYKPDLLIGNNEGVYWSIYEQRPTAFVHCRFLSLLHSSGQFPGFDCREVEIAQVLVALLDGQLRSNDLGLAAAPHTTLVKRHFVDHDRLRKIKVRCHVTGCRELS